MTLKDLIEVIRGDDRINICRDIYSDDGYDCEFLYDGSVAMIPKTLYLLKVVNLEPNSVGFNVDVNGEVSE